ncbi:hypothetical protein [Flexivirga meconopsidis]|uniref:hypothetical protein n=1 Tax=Flexivirga meconopsidis TaxID=2977121 RepID=UPI00223EEE07|nr:hypothetical protein [Flexivirga meconopsidis]
MQVVVTGVRSRTHLIHIAAYLREGLSRTDRVDLTYLTGGTFLGHAAVDELDVRQLLPDDPALHVRFVSRLAELSDIEGDVTYVSVGAPGIKPWIALRRGDFRRRLSTVVTDEGIGTYGDWRTRRDAWRRQGVREPWTTMRAVAVEGGVRGLTTRRFPMYDEGRDFAPHPSVAAEFLRHTEGMAPDPSDGRVVFLGQPWVEIGALSADAYLAHVDHVARRVAADGGRLVIRPHPAEHPNRYGAREVLAGIVPAELDPQVVSASGVIGGASTALLNLAALHGMPATRVLTPGLEHLEDELGVRQRALLDRYLPPAVDLDR